ncbi:hypothetical protein N6H14_11225 [Paenibacillus sp. CC-CFT747]|nr:hypothetical protein N6H14_11225 [Paenibacillus sp. CC-CFT747]
MRKVDTVRLLYVVSDSGGDPSAYDNFRQTLLANAEVKQAILTGLSERQLGSYDAVYLDPGLAGTGLLQSSAGKLETYVREGATCSLRTISPPISLRVSSAARPFRTFRRKPPEGWPSRTRRWMPMLRACRRWSSCSRAISRTTSA